VEVIERMIKLPSIDCEQVADEIGNFIVQQCSHHKGAVIGLSGGVDSSLVAFLAKRAFDKRRWTKGEQKKSFMGVYVPANENTDFSKECVDEVVNILELPFKEICIKDSIRVLEQNIDNNNHIIKDIYGNMVSRLRSNVLWTMAAIRDSIVLGTGNADEDFGVGYYTLGGDGLVSCSPIGMLSKRLVYELARWIGVPDKIINRKPTAELNVNQTDENDLGYTYALVEIIIEFVKQNQSPPFISASQDSIVDYLLNNYSKFIDDNLISNKWTQFYGKTKKDAIEDILYRHRGAIYKQQIVNPPIAKITLNYNIVCS
jgi:NAD+ synthase